jgi:hypothetical protein
MDIKTFDLVLLFVLSLCLSLVIAINVLFVVDKKLNNLKINVPVCPTPIVNVNGSKVDISYQNNIKKNNNETFSVKPSEQLGTYNNFTTGILNRDGSITKQNISLYQPKQYMNEVSIGTLNNDNKNIEVPSDVDQMGSSLTDYTNDPVPLGSQLFREYY